MIMIIKKCVIMKIILKINDNDNHSQNRKPNDNDNQLKKYCIDNHSQNPKKNKIILKNMDYNQNLFNSLFL